jgi:hypothetical protein
MLLIILVFFAGYKATGGAYVFKPPIPQTIFELYCNFQNH